MDMDKAREIVREQIEKHRTLAKRAEQLGVCILADDHREIADALHLLLEVTE